MKKAFITSVLFIGCWMLCQPDARSQEGAPREEAPLPRPVLPPVELPPVPTPLVPPPGPSCAACPARTIPLPQFTLLEQQKAITVPQLNLREEVVGKACGLDVEYKEQKQIVMEWSVKPREVIQDVPCTTMVPETVTDPCTGECRTIYKSCPIVRQVKVTVYDTVPVERVVVVGVPCLKPGNPLLVKKLVVDTTMEPAICTKMQLLTMPNEVAVPVCPVCPVPHLP